MLQFFFFSSFFASFYRALSSRILELAFSHLLDHHELHFQLRQDISSSQILEGWTYETAILISKRYYLVKRRGIHKQKQAELRYGY